MSLEFQTYIERVLVHFPNDFFKNNNIEILNLNNIEWLSLNLSILIK